MVVVKWWEKDKDEKHLAIFELAKRLEHINEGRHDRLLNYARLYSNYDIAGLDPHNYIRSNDIGFLELEGERSKYNLIGSVVDTLVSRIAKNKPKINVLPTGANWTIQTKARKLERYIQGVFYETSVYDSGILAFLQAICWGTGVVYPFMNDDGNIEVETIPVHELWVDPREAIYGKPRQIFRRKHMDKSVLSELFKKNKLDIETAGKLLDESDPGETISDLVTVIEAWRLPTSLSSEDGRHTICVDNAVLLDEEYNKADFPFVFLRWKRPLMAFWGIGLVQELMGIQLDINYTLSKIQKAHHLLANPHVYVHVGSTISKPHIQRNDTGSIIPYSGAVPPTVQTFQVIHPEIYQHLEAQMRRGYEIAGVSQLAAQSKNVLGPNASGAAIRELSDIESERFAVVSQDYDEFYVNLADKMIDLAREAYKTDEGAKLKFTVKGKKFIEQIDWKEIDLDADQFVLELEAGSSLPKSKAGKIQTATDWLQVGAITPQEWRDIIEMPDLERKREIEKGPEEYIKKVIEEMLYEGVVIEPEKFDNLSFALKYAILTYSNGKINGAPEERLDLLRQFIEKVDAMLAPPPEAMPAPQEGLPGEIAAPSTAQMPPPIPGAPGAVPAPNM